ncbi:MAG: enoyl-CoA hydratase [Caulobacterales bacterium 32-69-10]|nr:MAG: enoyl-CoA hydratase [Caulobacterales bacterium 32-69-10]
MTEPYTCLLLERDGPVAIVRLNRPEALNALSDTLMNELSAAIDSLEADEAIACIVLTGSEKAFAAGADIREMAGQGYAEAYRGNFITRNWERVVHCRKPVIAAVAGYALGGGCELAMMCDFILAADNARFGQPEINLGIVPGAGGTQRLTRALGKAKAMEMVLTGRMIDAAEAERCGLASRVVPLAELLPEAIKAGRTIAGLSPMAVAMAKELVGAAFETPLAQGIALERRMFQSLFGLEDQKEGMAAFLEKRKPVFKGR